MIYNYFNYKGGINNLCVVSESFSKPDIIGKSTIDLKHAIKNFKRNYKKYYGKKYKD